MVCRTGTLLGNEPGSLWLAHQWREPAELTTWRTGNKLCETLCNKSFRTVGLSNWMANFVEELCRLCRRSLLVQRSRRRTLEEVLEKTKAMFNSLEIRVFNENFYGNFLSENCRSCAQSLGVYGLGGLFERSGKLN